MNLTLPQIVLLNAASRVNYKRTEVKTDSRKTSVDVNIDEKDPIVYKGLRMSQLNDDELTIYYNKW